MNNKVRLPRSSYDELCKIIKAYGQIHKPAPLSEISALSTIGSTKVSANNAFLSFVNIIEGGNKKSATPAGRALAIALEHELLDKVSKAWREIVENNEFLNKMTLAVKIRRVMEPSALISHIAYNAGEKKSKVVMTGARAVLDILRNSGLIKEDDGKIVPSSVPIQPSEEVKIQPDTHRILSDQKELIRAKEIQFTSNFQQGITVNIDVQIQAKPSDLDGLGVKLRSFLKQISEIEERDENESNED